MEKRLIVVRSLAMIVWLFLNYNQSGWSRCSHPFPPYSLHFAWVLTPKTIRLGKALSQPAKLQISWHGQFL